MRTAFCILLGLLFSTPAAAQGGDPPPTPPTPAEVLSLELAVARSPGSTSPGEAAGPGSLTPDAFTGGAHYQIALPLPPMRGFDMPPPTLVYSSRSGNGIAGVGWTLEFGSIAITRQHGDPGQTDLVHHSAGGTVRLQQTGPGEYGVEVAPPFDTYRRDANDNWIKTDASGAEQRFSGLGPNAGIGEVGRTWALVSGIDPSGNQFNVTYRFDSGFAYIAKVDYGGFAGPGAPAIAPYMEYRFTYEVRPDPVETFRDGRTIRIGERIRSAELYAGGTLQRTYQFEYTTGETGRSLLNQLIEIAPGGQQRTLLSFGYSPMPVGFEEPSLVVPANIAHAEELRWTGVEGSQAQFVDFMGGNSPRFCAPSNSEIICRALDGSVPPTTQNDPGGYLTAAWGDLDEAVVRPVDANDDGLPDICLLQQRLTCWLTANGRVDRAIAGPSWSITDRVTVGSLRFGDVNGDGYPDACRLHASGIECVPGSATGFKMDAADIINGPSWRADQQTGIYMPWSAQEHYSTIALVDVDRDGADDLCGRTEAGIECYRGSRNGFDLLNPIQGPRWSDPPIVQGDLFPTHGYARTNWMNREHYGTIAYPDINGDGLPDICARDADGIVCYLNRAGRFDLTTEIRGPQWTGPFTTPPPAPGQSAPPEAPGARQPQWEREGRWRSIGFYDINGDGLADVCGRANTGFDCYLSNGAGFPNLVQGPRISDNYSNVDFLRDREYFQSIRVVDINGDARPDFCARLRDGVRCWLNRAGLGEMLVSIREHLGATVSLTYGPASHTPASRIPFATPVLTEYRRDSGNGTETRTRFDYAGGFAHARSGTFRGFSLVTETIYDQSDRALRVRTTRFAQATATSVDVADDLSAVASPMKGRVLEEIVGLPLAIDSRMTVAAGDRDVVRNRYRVQPAFGRQFTYADRIESWSCSSGICDVAPVVTEFAYDRGYLQTERSYGLPATPDDDITTRYTYRWHPTGPFARVESIERFRGIATVQSMQRTAFLYDEMHNCDPAALAGNSSGWGRGLVTRITRTAGVSQQVTLADFDHYGNAICAHSPASGRTETDFDVATHSFAVASRNALGHITRQAFAGVNSPQSAPTTLQASLTPISPATSPLSPPPFGALLQTVAVTGAATDYGYDFFGRVITIREPMRGTRRIEYHAVGQPRAQHIRTISPSGIWSESYFDGDRRFWRQVRPDADGGGLSESQEFDLLGNVVSATMARLASEPARISRFEYDYRGRVVRAESVTGDVTRHCYLGHTETIIGPTAKRTDRITDQLGRLTSIVQYQGEALDCSASPGLNPTRTSFEYHPFFGLNRIHDDGRDIRVQFDDLGRRSTVADSRVGTSHYVYGARGLLQSFTGGDGARRVYAYDALGRPTEKTESRPRGESLQTRYFYDGTVESRGRLTSFETGNLSTTLLYRLDGLLASTIRTVGERTYVINRQYDGDGNMSQLVYPDGYAVRYVNSGGYLREVQDANGALITFDQFDGVGRPLVQRFRNGLVNTMTFAGGDADWCPANDLYLCGIDLTGPTGQTVWRGRQQLDAARRVMRTADSATGESQYQYDEEMRLIGSTGGASTFRYSYDAQDNLITNGDQTFAYVDGRLQRANGRTYVHDAGGRVQRINRPLHSTVEIGYDVRGRLNTLGTAEEASFLFDDSDRLARLSVNGHAVDVVDDLAECPSEDRCRNMLFIGGGLAAVVGGRGEDVFFYHGDFRGSIRAVTGDDGAVLQTYAYGPYGEQIGAAQGDPAGLLLRRGYLGAPQLPATGYHLLGIRLYDPQIGRFLQPDEGSPSMAVLRRANPYSYGFNSPLTYADPNGDCPVCVVVAIGAALGATHAIISKRNILEGALMGGLAAAGGYYAAPLVGSTFWGTVASQSVIGGIEATTHNENVLTGMARGAVAGALTSGLGQATMGIVPIPTSQLPEEAIMRQFARDFMRGSAKSVLMAALQGESDPFRYALPGGITSAGFGLAQTYTFAVIASAAADGPVQWTGTTFVVPTQALSAQFPAMRLGMFTLMEQQDPNLIGPPTLLGHTVSEAGYQQLLVEENRHGAQYNMLGHDFLPAYAADWAISGFDHDRAAMEREAHPWLPQ